MRNDTALILWIPQIIYSDKDISPTAKLILAEIFNLLKINNQCFASNDHFANMFGLERANVSYHIQSLIKHGWIFSEALKHCQREECIFKDKGWHRHIIAGETLSKILDSLSKKTIDPIKSDLTPYQVGRHHKSNIESNIENKENLKKIDEIKKRTKSLLKGI